MAVACAMRGRRCRPEPGAQLVSGDDQAGQREFKVAHDHATAGASCPRGRRPARPPNWPATHLQRQVAEVLGRRRALRPGPAQLPGRPGGAHRRRQPGRDVLDVGCGTGIASRLLAAAGCRVLGVDADPRMAAAARELGTETQVAKFEDWDPAGRAFDAVVAAQAWHWVDPVAGAAKAAAVLRPGGRLTVSGTSSSRRRSWGKRSPRRSAGAARLALPAALLGPARRQGYPEGEGRRGGGRNPAGGHVQRAGRVAAPWQRQYTTDEWLHLLPTTGGFAPAAGRSRPMAGRHRRRRRHRGRRVHHGLQPRSRSPPAAWRPRARHPVPADAGAAQQPGGPAARDRKRRRPSAQEIAYMAPSASPDRHDRARRAARRRPGRVRLQRHQLLHRRPRPRAHPADPQRQGRPGQARPGHRRPGHGQRVAPRYLRVYGTAALVERDTPGAASSSSRSPPPSHGAGTSTAGR